MASYEQSKSSKLWSVRFRATIDGIEKNMRLSGFRTKKEAQSGYISFVNEQAEKEKKQEKILTPVDMLFSALADKYLAHQKTRIKESSYITIESKINKHIIPCFKDMAIKDITPLTVLEWQHSIDHYAYKHKSSLRTQLTSIFKYGERYIGIPNVMARVEPFRNTEPKKDVQCWSYEEFTRFIKCCEDLTYNMFFKLLYISGCRKGEALALSWDDIDFDKQTIRINKNLTRKTSELYKIISPKNVSSIRTVDMPVKFLEELKEYKAKLGEAVGNDVNTSMGITLLYDVLKAELSGATKREIIGSFDEVLSLDLLKAEAVEESGVDAQLEAYVLSKIEERKAAKKEKNFALADAIRNELLEQGIILEDTREGVKWKKA